MRTRKAVRPKFPVESYLGNALCPPRCKKAVATANNAGATLVLGYCSALRKETGGNSTAAPVR
jgi:hypothetical protein